MDRRRVLIIAALCLPALALAAQGGPVYTAAPPYPVAGAACSTGRVQVQRDNGKRWCCVASVWADCSSTDTVTATGGTTKTLADWMRDGPTAMNGNGSSVSVTATGSTTARTLAARAGDSLDVLDCGADPTGAADAAAAFQSCGDTAKAAGKILTAKRGTFLLAGSVTLRQVGLDLRGATINVSNGAMLIVGGNAASTDNPDQRLGKVTRVGGMNATPTVRVQGSKDQTLAIRYVDFVQLYADTSTGNGGPDYSIAYSNFVFDFTQKIELATNAGTPNSQEQWINENTFFLKRATAVVIGGTYPHNHNWFYGGTFEGAASINVQKGSSNIFWGTRFEGYVPTLTFAAGTWANKVVVSWESNQGTWADNDGLESTSANITDAGDGNVVTTLQKMTQRRIPVVVVNARTHQVFTNDAGAAATANPGTIQGVGVQRGGIETFTRETWATVYSSPLIPVGRGDAFSFESDATLFRPWVTLYDANGALLAAQNDAGGTPRARMSGSAWDAGASAWTTNGNISRFSLSVSGSDVAFAKVGVIAGNATAGVEFKRFAIHRITSSSFAAREAEATLQGASIPIVSSSPARGFAALGTKVASTGGGWFAAVRSVDTTLAAPAALAATEITATNVPAGAIGDVVGVILDSGATHWTTAAQFAGNVVTLAVGLPSAAAAGNRIVWTGWTGAVIASLVQAGATVTEPFGSSQVAASVVQEGGVAGVTAYVQDGANNRRAQFFVDDTAGEWGLRSSYSVGAPVFTLYDGGIKKVPMPAQADSVAADVTALKADLNTLLGKLRTAGLLTP